MAKSGSTLLAEHFGTDSETIRDNEYQHGRFNKPVYSLGNEFWAGGKVKPKDEDGILTNWVRIISSYDPNCVLWLHNENR